MPQPKHQTEQPDSLDQLARQIVEADNREQVFDELVTAVLEANHGRREQLDRQRDAIDRLDRKLSRLNGTDDQDRPEDDDDYAEEDDGE